LEPRKKTLKKSVINLYGLPSFGFQLFVKMEIFFFAAFLTDYAKIPVAIAGTVLMVTSIFDIVWVPTAGVILEKSSMRWERYRSWLLVGPPLATVFFVLQFSKIGDPTINAVLISVGFIISHLIWNIFYAGHIAMNNSMTMDREERISMASNRGMFNSLGSICFSMVGAKSIQLLGGGNQALGCTLTVIVSGTLMTLCYWTLFSITRDYAYHSAGQAQAQATDKMGIGEMFKQIIVNPPLIGLMLAELGRYLGRFVIFGMAFYYFKYVVNNLTVIAVFFTGLNVVCFFGAMTTVDYGEWKIGKNARGFIMSLISFPIKTAIFVRSVVITGVLVSAGYVADMAPTPELISGIKNGIALIPALFIGAGLIIILALYRITPESQKRMQQEIAARS
jgi:Na+/melibiose symporter-like transporter